MSPAARSKAGTSQHQLGSRSGRSLLSPTRVLPPEGMCYFMCVMDRVGVRELRQNLSVYLRRVKLGERLEVTERGQVVARLEPIVDDADPIARLEREGRILRRSTGDLSKIRPLRLDLERPLSTILEEMREDTA